MTFITRQDCSYKILRDMYELYDLSFPDYIQHCDNCQGDKDCKVTLDELVRSREEDIGHIIGEGK